MARAEALANQLADGAVARLKVINAGPGLNQWGAAADANKWFTQPLSVARGLLSRFLTQESAPAIAVEVGSWKSEQVFAGRHRVTIQLQAHLKVQGDAENAERDINRLAADACFTLSQDETLGGVAIMFADDFAYDPQTELRLASGLAIATVTFSVVAEYDHTITNPT